MDFGEGGEWNAQKKRGKSVAFTSERKAGARGRNRDRQIAWCLGETALMRTTAQDPVTHPS